MGKYNKSYDYLYDEHVGFYDLNHFYTYLDCFHDVNRDEAEKILKGMPEGTFLVRPSAVPKKKGIYLNISLVNDKIIHRLICLTNRKNGVGLFGKGLLANAIIPKEESFGIYLDTNYDPNKALLTDFAKKINLLDHSYTHGAVVGFFNSLGLPPDISRSIAAFLDRKTGGILAQTTKSAALNANDELDKAISSMDERFAFIAALNKLTRAISGYHYNSLKNALSILIKILNSKAQSSLSGIQQQIDVTSQINQFIVEVKPLIKAVRIILEQAQNASTSVKIKRLITTFLETFCIKYEFNEVKRHNHLVKLSEKWLFKQAMEHNNDINDDCIALLYEKKN